MNTCQENNYNLNNDEIHYRNLLINPFDTPVIRAPSLFPRKCGIYKCYMNTTYYASSSSTQWISISFNPENMIFNSETIYFTPLVFQEFASVTATATKTRPYQNMDYIATTTLTSNEFEYRLIAGGLRSMQGHVNQTSSGFCCGLYTTANNGWSNVTIDGNSVPYPLMPFYTNTDTNYSYQVGGNNFEGNRICNDQNNYYITSFWTPTDDVRFQPYYNLYGSLNTSPLYYFNIENYLNGMLGNAHYQLNAGSSMFLQVECVAVFEVVGNYLKNYTPYPNYSVKSLDKIMNSLPLTNCYYSDGSYNDIRKNTEYNKNI